MKLHLIASAVGAAMLLAGSASAATIIYVATPSGAGEVPAVASPGTSTATLTLDDVTGAWTLTGSFANLTSNITNAHIHGPSAAGQPGVGVVKQLQFTAGVTSGTISGSNVASSAFTAAQMAELAGSLYYVNIHSVNFGGGEMRGQLVLVPEPGASVLAGLLGLGLLRRRR